MCHPLCVQTLLNGTSLEPDRRHFLDRGSFNGQFSPQELADGSKVVEERSWVRGKDPMATIQLYGEGSVGTLKCSW